MIYYVLTWINNKTGASDIDNIFWYQKDIAIRKAFELTEMNRDFTFYPMRIFTTEDRMKISDKLKLYEESSNLAKNLSIHLGASIVSEEDSEERLKRLVDKAHVRRERRLRKWLDEVIK